MSKKGTENPEYLKEDMKIPEELRELAQVEKCIPEKTKEIIKEIGQEYKDSEELLDILKRAIANKESFLETFVSVSSTYAEDYKVPYSELREMKKLAQLLAFQIDQLTSSH